MVDGLAVDCLLLENMPVACARKKVWPPSAAEVQKITCWLQPPKNAAREKFCRQPLSLFTLQQLLLSLTPVFILSERTFAFLKKDLRLIQLLSLVNAAANNYFVLLQKE